MQRLLLITIAIIAFSSTANAKIINYTMDSVYLPWANYQEGKALGVFKGKFSIDTQTSEMITFDGVFRDFSSPRETFVNWSGTSKINTTEHGVLDTEYAAVFDTIDISGASLNFWVNFRDNDKKNILESLGDQVESSFGYFSRDTGEEYYLSSPLFTKVPEPSTITLLLLGLVVIGAQRKLQPKL